MEGDWNKNQFRRCGERGRWYVNVHVKRSSSGIHSRQTSPPPLPKRVLFGSAAVEQPFDLVFITVSAMPH